MFSSRQLLCHGVSVEVFREMLDADQAAGSLDELHKAAYGYSGADIGYAAELQQPGCRTLGQHDEP